MMGGQPDVSERNDGSETTRFQGKFAVEASLRTVRKKGDLRVEEAPMLQIHGPNKFSSHR